jgi:hypothetical protein
MGRLLPSPEGEGSGVRTYCGVRIMRLALLLLPLLGRGLGGGGVLSAQNVWGIKQNVHNIKRQKFKS